VTNGYICAKVRKFDARVYGPDRLMYPAVRKGPKGEGRFKRTSWDEALELVADRFRRAKAEHGGESILPFSYGGSNGLLTQDNLDAQLWRRFRTSRLARTLCAAPTGAANQALYGKMASVTYQDYPAAALIILWGVNPSASGIHLVPYVREAQKGGAKLVVIDPRTTALAFRSSQARMWPSLSQSIATSSPTAAPTRRFFATTRTAQIVCVSALRNGRLSARRTPPESIRRLWSRQRSCTRKAHLRSSVVAGVSSVIATEATPRWRCWHCRPSAGSLASVAAVTP
jgi:hypothetical protein